MEILERTSEIVEHYLRLYDLELEQLQQEACKLTQQHFKNKIEFCSIISAKTGLCPEDCSYCAQSSHFNTNCISHNLVGIDSVIKSAKDAKSNGATRFCVVTSGKGVETAEEFSTILEMVNAVSNIEGLHSCCSLGIVDLNQAVALKEAGVERFNHNVNTASSYYKNICSTHSYKERLETAKTISTAGIELCCGGIIGLGESRYQRIEMALEIKSLKPTSVPVNFLHPISGTPLENLNNSLTPEEILKTLAIFRIIMPDVLIRYAGGRTHHLDYNQQLQGLNCGVNALLVGNYLTTTGTSPQDDHHLINTAGMELIKE